jgi:hypothetical protein
MAQEQWIAKGSPEELSADHVEKSAKNLEHFAESFWTGKNQASAQDDFQHELDSIQHNGKEFVSKVFDKVQDDCNSKTDSYLPVVSFKDDGKHLQLKFEPGNAESVTNLPFHSKGIEARVGSHLAQTYFNDYSSYQGLHGYSRSIAKGSTD